MLAALVCYVPLLPTSNRHSTTLLSFAGVSCVTQICCVRRARKVLRWMIRWSNKLWKWYEYECGKKCEGFIALYAHTSFLLDSTGRRWGTRYWRIFEGWWLPLCKCCRCRLRSLIKHGILFAVVNSGGLKMFRRDEVNPIRQTTEKSPTILTRVCDCTWTWLIVHRNAFGASFDWHTHCLYLSNC